MQPSVLKDQHFVISLQIEIRKPAGQIFGGGNREDQNGKLGKNAQLGGARRGGGDGWSWKTLHYTSRVLNELQ